MDLQRGESEASAGGGDAAVGGDGADGSGGREPRSRSLETVTLDRIRPRPHNRSISAEHVTELAVSIEQIGLDYPILLWRLPDADRSGGIDFEIIDGEHRFHAFKKLGRTSILAIVDDNMDAARADDAASHANRWRRAPTLWDSFLETLRRRARDHDSVDVMSKRTGLDRATCARLFAVQDYVCPELWHKLESAPTWETMMQLRACGRIGRDGTKEARRDAQTAWWESRGWEQPSKTYTRRPTRNHVRRKVASIDPKELISGQRVRRLLLWTIGEREDAIPYRPPQRIRV